MKFKVGDMAVYPGHGVGVVEGVETREIAGSRQTFYVLKIIENAMTIMVPTSNADAIGMREVISGDEVEEIYKVLLDREMDHPVVDEIREVIAERGSGSETVIADLHVWRVGKAAPDQQDTSAARMTSSGCAEVRQATRASRRRMPRRSNRRLNRYKIELIQTKSITYEEGRQSDAKSADPLRSA